MRYWEHIQVAVPGLSANLMSKSHTYCAGLEDPFDNMTDMSTGPTRATTLQIPTFERRPRCERQTCWNEFRSRYADGRPC